MKKVSMIIAALAIVMTSFAATGSFIVSPKKASDIYIPLGKTVQISPMDLSNISVKDYEKVTGKNLNLFQKIAFKATQKKLRNSIAQDGTVTNKKLLKALSAEDHSVGFHIGGFALGFFLGLIGVLIAYIIKGDEAVDRNRRKWAWIGLGAFVVLYIILLLSISPVTYY